MSSILLQVIFANGITRLAAVWAALRLTDRAAAHSGGMMLGVAAGLLLTFASTHLLPEAFEHPEGDPHALGLVFGGTILTFLLLGMFASGHLRDAGRSTRAAAVLTGGILHSVVDGLLVASAFWMDAKAGWMVALAVLTHELPQQMGYLVILRAAGVERRTAVVLCVLTACAAVLGGVAGILGLHAVEAMLPYALMVSAASFLYITLFGLLPEVAEHAQTHGWRWRSLASVAAGAAISVILLGPGHDHDGAHAHLHDHAQTQEARGSEAAH